MMLIGSICLTRVPRELVKKVKCSDGVERCYLNIAIIEKKEKDDYGNTHFISCSPKKEEQKDGVSYFIGDLKPYEKKNITPAPEEINAAPVASADDLPF